MFNIVLSMTGWSTTKMTFVGVVVLQAAKHT